jgi:hypothetical protein
MGVGLVATGITVLGLSGLALVPTAAAAENQAVAAIVALHGGGGGGLRSEEARAAAADALGLTVAELELQLRGGESLADLADTAGVELQVVLDAVTAANVAVTRAAIAQAVTDGTLTQAKADWLIEGLDAGYWGSEAGGFGFGGRGGPRPFGGRPGQAGTEAAPTTVAPANES